MATVEYVALIVLVCAALAIGSAAADAGALGGAVTAQMRRALCLVTGGDCLGPGGPAPCVVRADGRARDARVSVIVLRLRDGRHVLREERSDGTVRVTVAHGDAVGVGLGAGARLALGRRAVDASAELAGDAEATSGRAYVLPDGAAADRLIERLEREDPPIGGGLAGLLAFARGEEEGGEDERFTTVGGAADAKAALRALGIEVGASALDERTVGVAVDRRSGTRTVALRLASEITAVLGASLGGLGKVREGSVDVALTFDRDGRAVALTVRRVAGRATVLRLPGLVHRRGDRLELEARLDLADAHARRLIDRLVDGDLGAARALAGRLAARARLDARVYRTRRDARTIGGSIAIGARVGGEVTTVVDSARLVDAVGREPGQGWMRRLDCVSVA
jgi:hypothetical protein